MPKYFLQVAPGNIRNQTMFLTLLEYVLSQERSFYCSRLFIISILNEKPKSLIFFLQSFNPRTAQVFKLVSFCPSWRVASWLLLWPVRFHGWFWAHHCSCPLWWRTCCGKWIQQCKDHGKLIPLFLIFPPKGNLFQLVPQLAIIAAQYSDLFLFELAESKLESLLCDVIYTLV